MKKFLIVFIPLVLMSCSKGHIQAALCNATGDKSIIECSKIIEHENKILGGAGISELKESTSDICELQKMYFHKSIRGKGLGNKMIDKCLAFAIKSNFTKCYIETMPNMLSAQKLYNSIGFEYIDKPLGNTGHSSCPVWMIKTL